MKNIAVIGTGDVGLVSGTCFAETGNNVICVDIDEKKIEKMRQGVVPIYEPHFDVVFERNIKAGRLTFTTNLEEAVDAAEIILSFFFNSDSFTPITIVLSAFLQGAETITFFAPLFK